MKPRRPHLVAPILRVQRCPRKSSVTARGAADMVPGMGGPVSFARCLNYNLDSQSPVDSYSERSPIQVMVEGTPLVRPPTRYAGADTVTRMARAQVMSDTSTGIRTRTPEPTRAPSDSPSQLESRLHLSSFRSAFRGLVHTMRGYGEFGRQLSPVSIMSSVGSFTYAKT